MNMVHFNSVAALDCTVSHEAKGLVGFRHLARRNRTVVIFIHGLGGSSLGAKRTWVNLPEFVWEDEPDVDIAFHSYDTLFRRLLFWRSISLKAEAGVLADNLSLLEYDHIVLVGHSLGGVLARLTLKALTDRSKEQTLSKIASVILMASPTLGAKWVSRLFGWLSHDFRALQRDGEAVRDIEQLYSARLSPRFSRKMHTHDCVPLWAITAAADSWVSSISASAQVPDDQRRSAKGSHTEVVKPRSKSAPAYGHFLTMLRRIVSECQPAIVHRITVKGFEIRPAIAADSAAVLDLARRAFPGEQLSPAEAMVTWLKWDPYCFWILKKLADVGGEIRGYWCAFSLTAPALELIKSGRLTGPQLRYEHFAEGRRDQAGIYVGAVVGSGDFAKGLVMKHAQKELKRRTGGQIFEIVARAVTEDGLRLVKTHGFAAVDRDQVGSVFSGTSTVRARRRGR